jgi:hypothetical protein
VSDAHQGKKELIPWAMAAGRAGLGPALQESL